MKDSLMMTKWKEREFLHTQTEIVLKDNSKIIKKMVKELTS